MLWRSVSASKDHMDRFRIWGFSVHFSSLPAFIRSGRKSDRRWYRSQI